MRSRRRKRGIPASPDSPGPRDFEWPDAFREHGVYLQEDAPVMVCGEYNTSDRPKIVASEIYPLNEVHRHFTQKLSLHLPALDQARLRMTCTSCRLR